MGADSQSTGYKLRQNLNMYASVAHVKSLEGLQSKYANIDCVIIREQSEEWILNLNLIGFFFENFSWNFRVKGNCLTSNF